MISTSAEYNTAIAHNTRELKIKANISGADITGEYLIDAIIEELVNTGETLAMGCTCSNKLTLNMRMPSPAIALRGAEIALYSGLVVDGVPEWVPLGVFYVSELESITDYQTVTVIAYDGMSKLEDVYTPGITEWPATIQAVAEDICAQTGQSLAEGITWPEYTIPSGTYDAGYTCREMIGFIAGMMGKNARFNRAGELTFCWYADSDTEITRALQYQNGLERLLPEAITISSITTGTEDNAIVSGAGRGIEFFNPFITQAIADDILAGIYGFTYAPARVKWRGNPALEAGDIVTAETRSGEMLAVPVMQQRIVLTGGLYGEITAPGSTETQIAMGKAPSAVKLERLYAGLSEAFRAATDKLTGASGGYFKLETDELGFPSGWVIMDTPELTPYTKLWRFNAAGLAWSGDGGATYSNIAITMDGQISANAITAGAMNAERIAVEKYGEEGEQTLESYIRFGDGSITLGKTGNDLSLKIESDKISFISNTAGTTVAYFANNALVITDVEKIQFGPFRYVPRSNGNLSFMKKVD